MDAAFKANSPLGLMVLAGRVPGSIFDFFLNE